MKDLSKSVAKLNELYSFDIDKMELIDNEKNEVPLNKNEKNLIFLLVKNLSHTVSYDKIIEYVWQDKPINSNTLRTQIKKLRSKLKKDFIVNIRGSGYKIDKYGKT
ncbi:MAG: helix-turn-helix domain-containing protein [Epsilonproteobacteria bacterium]|nr:helix-turn-helix domain-containing protein [Campylobacterota bacterium]